MFDYSPDLKYDIPAIVQEYVVDDKANAISWKDPLRSIALRHLACMTDEELDKDWKLNDFFGTIAVINLPCDTERLSIITEELHSLGVQDFLVFPAIDGRKEVDAKIWKKFYQDRVGIDLDMQGGSAALDRLHQGEAGCYMSHYTLIRIIRDAFANAMVRLKSAVQNKDPQAILQASQEARKYSRVLILEDDNGFGFVNKDRSASTRDGAGRLLRVALQELPDAWDMLYFMCFPHQRSVQISPHWCRLRRSFYLNAYVVNHTMYDPLIEHLEKIEDPKIKHILPVDKYISEIHNRHKIYAIYPSIAFQYNTVSSIDGRKSSQLVQHQPKLDKNSY